MEEKEVYPISFNLKYIFYTGICIFDHILVVVVMISGWLSWGTMSSLVYNINILIAKFVLAFNDLWHK